MMIKRFKIVSPRDVQSTDNIFETLLLNLNHIISLKPIKMVIEDKVIEGYWIRTSNGKKYRAIEIPKELKLILDNSDESETLLNGSSEALPEAQFLN
jgi:hypothetical protein